MHRGTPYKVDIIRPTIGWEGELTNILFALLIDKKICFANDDEVLTVIKPTKTGLLCVQDNLEVDENFRNELIQIRRQKNLLPIPVKSYSHIFEFVTPPTKNTPDLAAQFDEIAQIEGNLIQYLLKQQNEHPNIGLVCVKDWIDDYNKRFPNHRLSPTKDASKMYIVPNYSIAQLKLNEAQKKDWRESVHPSDLAKNHLEHGVQFNFVASLGKKMGSLLKDIHIKNDITEYQEKIASYQKILDDGINPLISKGYTKEKAERYLKKIEGAILALTKHLALMKEPIKILEAAEKNAESLCELIKSHKNSEAEMKNSKNIASRDMRKLEGFFFLLSMRILTETSSMQLKSENSSSKNKYIFLLKTKLSNLIHSLSENDKKILQDIQKTWSDTEKNQLLILIAGSPEALSTSFITKNHIRVTMKEVIESTLGWNKSKLCDELANTPTKPFAPPLEPVHLRGKVHETPLWRVLLEYRPNSINNLADSQKRMEDMLGIAAKFCETSYYQKTVSASPAVATLPHSVLFPTEDKESLAKVVKFKQDVQSALSLYTGKDRLGRLENIKGLIEKLPDSSNDANVYYCLDQINQELNRKTSTAGESKKLRKILNPILLEMLTKLSTSIDMELKQNLLEHTQSFRKQ